MGRQYVVVDAEQVTTRRARLHWSQKQLADKADLTKRTVQKVEAGGVNLLATVVQVAEALGVSHHELEKQEIIEAEPVPHSDETDRYREIWSSQRSVAAKIKETMSLYSHPQAQLIALEEKVDLHISKQGDADVEYRFKIANIGNKPIRGEFRRVWFEHAEKIEVTGLWNNRVPLSIRAIHEFSDSKHFYCTFQQPLEPGQLCRYSYRVLAKRAFLNNHFWDVSTSRLTNSISFTLVQETKRHLKECHLRINSPQGISSDETPQVGIHRGKELTRITWHEAFPLAEATYSLHWNFVET